MSHRLMQAIVLAAGKGNRMNSPLPKVLHKINGRAMLFYVLETMISFGIHKIYIVLGFKMNMVKAAIQEWLSQDDREDQVQIKYVHQKEQLGTGHAVMSATEQMQVKNSDEDVLIMLGDVPFVQADSLRKAYQLLESSTNAGGVVVTTEVENPNGYGRIFKASNGSVSMIIEENEASPHEKQIREVNTGIFLFKKNILCDHISQLNDQNTKKEYYLTDLVGIVKEAGYEIYAFKLDDPRQFFGINSQENLKEAERIFCSLREEIFSGENSAGYKR